jgi:hypothetical protein
MERLWSRLAAGMSRNRGGFPDRKFLPKIIDDSSTHSRSPLPMFVHIYIAEILRFLSATSQPLLNLRHPTEAPQELTLHQTLSPKPWHDRDGRHIGSPLVFCAHLGVAELLSHHVPLLEPDIGGYPRPLTHIETYISDPAGASLVTFVCIGPLICLIFSKPPEWR